MMENQSIPSGRSTQPSKFHQAWEGVKDVADAVFSCPVGWATVTGLAVLAGAITAAAGFGGVLGACFASSPFFAIAACIMQPGPLPDGSLVAYFAALLSSAALGVGVVALGFAPAVSVVLTIILAGVAVVGIAGLLGCGLAHCLKTSASKRDLKENPHSKANSSQKAQKSDQKTSASKGSLKENPHSKANSSQKAQKSDQKTKQTPYRLTQEAQSLYQAAKNNCSILQIWDMETFIEHGITTKEAIAFFRKEFGDRVFTFDTDFTEKTAEKLEPEARELFTKFDGKLFPKVNYIEAQRFNLQEISNLHRCSEFEAIVVKGRDRVSEEEYFDLLEKRNARKNR